MDFFIKADSYYCEENNLQYMWTCNIWYVYEWYVQTLSFISCLYGYITENQVEKGWSLLEDYNETNVFKLRHNVPEI